jgi:flagellum-specific peptidoglycan hydrolase FlgJ
LPSQDFANKEDFIKAIASFAVELGTDNHILPCLMIAQACLESGYGKHSPGNNLFGMKWTPGCGHPYQELWTKEWDGNNYVSVLAKFRKYKSFYESLADYTNLLKKSRYEPVRNAQDYLEATEQIRLCGYATSPAYTQSLRRIIEMYDLTEYDNV